MLKKRSDSWTEENDLFVVETVAKYVASGKTQMKGFEAAARVINRTAAAVGFRFNSVLRYTHEDTLKQAKYIRQKNRNEGKSYEQIPSIEVTKTVEGVFNSSSINHELSSILQKFALLEDKVRRLENENFLLKNQAK